MENINSDSLSEMMVILMNKDKKLTQSMIATEVAISKREVLRVKRGENVNIRYYIAIAAFIADWIGMDFDVQGFLKMMRKALSREEDLLIATVPHAKGKTSAPEEWRVLMKWDRG